MPTLKEVAEKFDITEEQANQLKQGMSSTWDAIGEDAHDFREFFDSEAAMVAEFTLDADRLKTYTRGGIDWGFVDDHPKAMSLGEAIWEASFV
tara:strand:- start:167 stop:445 length:279 start_codon:yes stop_codon:yes gene_type:complete